MQSFLRLTTILFSLLIIASCNNNKPIPFPEQELGYTSPVSMPLIFTAPKKLSWDTVQAGGMKPVVKTLDIEALPSLPFDSTGFRPFTQAPQEGLINIDQLPDTTFNLSALPSHSLDLHTTLLSPPVIIKASPPSSPKNHPISVYDIGTVHGLSTRFVGSVYKDSKGTLWIGAAEGLFRYDGQYVQNIFSAIGKSPVVGITEDNHHNIWFASYDGIGKVNMESGNISMSPKIGTNYNNVGKMTTDDKGNIWIYNLKAKAFSIVDPVTNQYKNIDQKAGLSDSLGFQMLQDDQKRIWLTTYTGGINIIDTRAGKIKYLTQKNGLSSNRLSAITTDKKNRLVIANNTGFDLLDTKTGAVKYYGKEQGLNPVYTLGVTVDSSGQIWCNTVVRTELVDINNNRVRYLSGKDGLFDNVITATIEDKQGRMWLGTLRGLNMVEQYGKTTSAFNETNIVSLMEDVIGNLWVATPGGIVIVNPERSRMRLLKEANGLADNFVQSFTQSNGSVIVATNGGFNIVDPVRKTISTASKKQGFAKDTIYSIFRDNHSNIWFTGPGDGIALFDSSKNLILQTDQSHGLSDNSILDIKQDNDGKYWLASHTNGINVIDGINGTVSYINDQPGFKDTSNKTILTDTYGRVWIGTYKGIYVADTKAKTITNISTKNGLANNRILSLLEYKGSIIAGTYNKINIVTAPVPGSKTDTAWKVSVLNGSEGILKNNTSWASDAITRKGEYLWGDNGITIINGINAATDSVKPVVAGITVMSKPLYFTRSSKDTINNTAYADRQLFSWDSVQGIYNLPVNLVIPYQKNHLQFQFGEASLSRQDTALYTYILEGIDKAWSQPTLNTNTENYLNLPSGNYSFKVCCKNLNGKWSQPAIFNFTISPPWYKSWWAYTLLALIAGALLRAYIVYRSRMLQKENRVLEEKVALRTKQLEQSLEDLKATQTQLIQSEKMASLGELTAGIAHEIQNPLNFINNFSEVNTELIAEMKEEIGKGNMDEVIALANDIQQNEQKITHHGKRADAIVKGMLQHSRNNNGQRELTDINALCDEYLRLSYHGLRAKDKSFNAKFETDFDSSIPKINIAPQDMGRVILNLINNAFYAVTDKKKKGMEGFEPLVVVSTKKEGNSIVIKVKDNGTGIPKSAVDKIFQPFFTTKPTGQGTGLGLSLSYDIIKAHGGELKVETKEGEETTFIIQLPTNN